MDGIKPDGVRYLGPAVDSKGRVPKYELPVGRAESLVVLLDEYRFFTPAILYLHGQFTDAPFFDCMYEQGRDISLYFKRFNKPIFRGLEARSNGNPDWNHVLWAVRVDDWEIISDFLCSLSWSLRDSGVLYSFAEQALSVVDPLALDRLGYYTRALPLLPITAYGMDGNTQRLAFQVPIDPFMAFPSLAYYAPSEEAQAFTQAYHAGDNPVALRDQMKFQRDVADALRRRAQPSTENP